MKFWTIIFHSGLCLCSVIAPLPLISLGHREAELFLPSIEKKASWNSLVTLMTVLSFFGFPTRALYVKLSYVLIILPVLSGTVQIVENFLYF